MRDSIKTKDKRVVSPITTGKRLDSRVRPRPGLNRLFRLVFYPAVSVVSIFGSLIAFPSFLPVVLLGWILVYLILVRTARGSDNFGESPRLPIGFCLGLIAFKFPEPTWALGLFVAALALALINPARFARTIPGVLFACWFIYAASFWWGARTSLQSTLDPQKPIVCLGDSLTDFGYPQELERMVSVPVKDFGFNGYMTEDGIKLIPRFLKLEPQAVIIELGGHDFKNGKSRFETRKNLITIIEACEAAGARVVIVEIPRGFINDPYYGLERQIAREKDLQLIPDTMIRRLVFWSPIVPPGSWVRKESQLSKDGLHPNDRGNRMMANYVTGALEAIFGTSIRMEGTW